MLKSQYQVAKDLELWCQSRHADLLLDYQSSEFFVWPEPINVTKNWKTSGCKWQGKMINHTMQTMQKLCNTFERVIFNCGFSLMEPHCEIAPHHGYTKSVLRYHYPLIVPHGDCAIQVGKEIYKWKEREAFVFDDTLLHSAWNRTGSPRLIILVDLIKSEL